MLTFLFFHPEGLTSPQTGATIALKAHEGKAISLSSREWNLCPVWKPNLLAGLAKGPLLNAMLNDGRKICFFNEMTYCSFPVFLSSGQSLWPTECPILLSSSRTLHFLPSLSDVGQRLCFFWYFRVLHSFSEGPLLRVAAYKWWLALFPSCPQAAVVYSSPSWSLSVNSNKNVCKLLLSPFLSSFANETKSLPKES